MPDWMKKMLAYIAVVVGILVVAWFVLDTWFWDRVKITNNSMAPTVVQGDVVLMWRDAVLDQGDVAICEHPTQPGRLVIGRLVGVPGGSLESSRYGLVVNNVRVAIDFRGEVQLTDPTTQRAERWRRGWEEMGYSHHWILMHERNPLVINRHVVARGLFLLSDHRFYRGEDSRTFGEVDRTKCKGQVFMVLFASDQAGEDFAPGTFPSGRNLHLVE